jgi:hypothetical protein
MQMPEMNNTTEINLNNEIDNDKMVKALQMLFWALSSTVGLVGLLFFINLVVTTLR